MSNLAEVARDLPPILHVPFAGHAINADLSRSRNLCGLLLQQKSGVRRMIAYTIFRNLWRIQCLLFACFSIVAHARMYSNQSNATFLTILPIGDSITEGFRSTDGNGYRLDLRNMLIGAGYNISFIGPLQSGENNPDNYNAGYGGKTIDQIEQLVLVSGILLQQPSLILLMAGTNDVDQNPPLLPYATAPQRLAAFIDVLISSCPNATILVATLIHDEPTLVHNSVGSQARVDAFNAQVPAIVAQRAAEGHHVQLVNQSAIGGDLLSDGLHPNDQGYQVMAQNWFNAIQNLPSQWLVAANSTNSSAIHGPMSPATTAVSTSIAASSTMPSSTSTGVPSSSPSTSAGHQLRLQSGFGTLIKRLNQRWRQ